MPWVHRDIDVHKCQRPNIAHDPDVHQGDIWLCPDCKTRWMVVEHQWDGKYFEPAT